jgi:hypothetical protein
MRDRHRDTLRDLAWIFGPFIVIPALGLVAAVVLTLLGI